MAVGMAIKPFVPSMARRSLPLRSIITWELYGIGG
jgi:hypothetical protein